MERKRRKREGKNKFAFDTLENSGNRSEWRSLSRENPALLRGLREREEERERGASERGRKWMQNNKRPVGHVDRGVIF